MSDDTPLRPWKREVVLQQASEEWLKVHGLAARGLTMDQILPSLGFRQRRGHVAALNRSIGSQYSQGLFTQHPGSHGEVYNLCAASPEKLQALEWGLLQMVAKLKARLEWLNTGSRLQFGVVWGRRVVLVIDSCATEQEQLEPLLGVASSVIQEQLSKTETFNIIRCTDGVESWAEELRESSPERVEEAVEWVGQTPVQSPQLQGSVVEALMLALEHSEADEVYVLAHGEDSLRACDKLTEKASSSPVPVNFVVFDCDSPSALVKYRQLASVFNGRCHAFSPTSLLPSSSSHHSLVSSSNRRQSPSAAERPSSDTENLHPPPSPRRSASGQSQAPSTPSPTSSLTLPREDVLLVWEELEAARDTLANIQALILETIGAEMDDHTQQEMPEATEDYLTSARWIKSHGVRTKKLMFHNLVSTLAFRHCTGVVELPRNSRGRKNDVQMIPRSKVVHAKYCEDFVHMRWKDSQEVVHVQLSERAFRGYEEKLTSVIDACETRVKWLKSGSREVFGTILEEKVVLVIDTSSSLRDRLDVIKDKLHQLIREQLSHKQGFTVLQFSSKVTAWREHLVPTSEQNLEAVWQWVQGLRAEGSTNTLGALTQALAVRGAEAVYLLTDGRPDQPCDSVLARVQQLPSLPVHTISFNCADSRANYFLARLASNTGGRYHYYCEDISDPNGPKAYESEDLRRLESEVALAREQLAMARELMEECRSVQSRSRGGRGGRGVKGGGGSGIGGGSGRGRRGGAGGIEETATKAVSEQSFQEVMTNGSRPESGTMEEPASSHQRKARLLSSRKWLAKNSLQAKQLTLMDALGPTAVTHSLKEVPLLGTRVHSRVFNNILPLAHISGNAKVSLINPNGVNLKAYEARLEQQLEVYRDRLSLLAWRAVPTERKEEVAQECGVSEGEIPSYPRHRDILRRVLEESGWPRPLKDFDLLEREVAIGESYQSHSTSLREEANRKLYSSPGETGRSSKKSRTQSEGSRSVGSGTRSIPQSDSETSLEALMSELQLHNRTPSPAHRGWGRGRDSRLGKGGRSSRVALAATSLQGRKVIARSSIDGFFYPGTVLSIERRRAVVQFADGRQQSTPTSYVLPVGGAGPCPALQCRDHVLVRVRTKQGPHPTSSGSCDYYVPGTVQVLPENPRRGHALHSIITFNRKTVTCARRGIVLVSPAQYSCICQFISHKRKEEEGEERDEWPEDESQASSYTWEEVPEKQSTDLDESLRSNTAAGSPVAPDGGEGEGESDRSNRNSVSQEEGKEQQGRGDLEDGRLLQSVLEYQRSHQQQLGEHSSAIASLREQQRELEGKLSQHEREEEEGEEEEVEEEGNLPTPRESKESPTAPPPPISFDETDAPEVGSASVQVREGEAVMCDQEVNTEPWVEDKAVETEPMTESRGVGTDWTDSLESSGSDSEKEKERDGHDRSSPHFTSTPQLSPKRRSSATNTAMSSHPAEISSFLTVHQLSPSLPPQGDPLIGQAVLVRWPDDGWYCRGEVVCPAPPTRYVVVDASGSTETIPLSDIITDEQDAEHTLSLGSTVIALHPDYVCSYAPGRVATITADGFHFTIDFYDGTQSTFPLPRQEVYWISPTKYDSVEQYILEKESAWVGREVVTRDNRDGYYRKATVVKQLTPSQQFQIRFPDGSTDSQNVVHMFDTSSKCRPLHTGDCVIALADSKLAVYMPGEIIGAKGGRIIIEFCDGKRSPVVPSECFWISEEYYGDTVQFFVSTLETSQTETDMASDTTSETGDVTPSYPRS